ncbi:MAG: carbohydrate kinase [Treponema sp.]|jgi:L-xylulokinase|nr:carbohydrate kinase [Treponema sp.]
MAKYVLGLDNGGTLVKAAIFDVSGREIITKGVHTPLLTPRPGYTERDMEALWRHNCTCVKDAITGAQLDPGDIIGVSVCGHGKGLYLWGKDDKPAYHGIVSTDSRAWAYPEKWYAQGTAQKLYPQTCQKLLASQQVALLAWLKDNERTAYDNIKWVFSVKDYIRFRLTGEAYSEVTDMSGSGLLDIVNCRFDPQQLDALGIGEVFDKLAPLRFSYEQCGSITKETAELTGLKAGTPVAGGMFDIDSCAVAMQVTTPEELCTIAGTWSINEYISRTPVIDGSIAMNSLFAIPGYFLVEECSATSAGNLDWFIDQFIDKKNVPEGKRLYDYIDELAASVSPEDCDVYFLPFLYGSNDHPLGKGALVGLTAYHELAHCIRAVYEGVVFSHKTHIDRLLKTRTPPKTIRMAGGAVNSVLWVQLFADILGIPIETIAVKELGALGCAMAAAIAAGEFKDYPEAVSAMVKIKQKVEPNREQGEIYRKKYEKYSAVCTALAGIWDKFSV